jgi:hypothetical protein
MHVRCQKKTSVFTRLLRKSFERLCKKLQIASEKKSLSWYLTECEGLGNRSNPTGMPQVPLLGTGGSIAEASLLLLFALRRYRKNQSATIDSPGTIGRVRGSAPRYAATPITTSAPTNTPSFKAVPV